MELDLASTVARRGQETPHDPWLFAPRGLSWRFLTFSQAAAELERLRQALAAIAGRLVAYPWRPTPEAWLYDLALQSLGAVPAPLRCEPLRALPARAARRRCELLVDCDGIPLAPGSKHGRPRGGAVVVVGSGPERWDAAAVAVAARQLGTSIGPSSGREIVLVWGELERAELRSLLSWASLVGAALLFEPSPARPAATLLWARPTVVEGTAAVLEELRRKVEQAAGRRRSLARRRRAVGRLRVIVHCGRQPLPAAEIEYWSRLGVRVARPQPRR